MRDDLRLDDAELRREIETVLARSPATQVASIGASIAQSHASSQFSAGHGAVAITGGSTQVSSRDLGRIYDIIWDLIIEGHVRPGLGDGENNALPYLHVTNKRKQYLDSLK